MRSSILFLLCLLSLLHGYGQSNDIGISIDITDLPLDITLDTIAERSHYQFSYNSEILPTGSLFTFKRENITVPKLLDALLVGTNLEYEIIDDQIILNSVKATLESFTVKKPKIQVSGWARSQNTKKPIEGVNVFINGTTIGTTTDQYGNYQLPRIDNGSHLLIFSYVGFESTSYLIEMKEGKVFHVNSLMNYRVSELEDVEITASPIVEEDKTEEYLKEFRQEFLGGSINSMECTFENPHVLRFIETKDNELASVETKEALTVINEALGYKMAFDLEYFEKDSGMTNFYAKARFESLTPSKFWKRIKQKRNRLMAYNGSILHFFRSLANNTIKKEGFIIQSIDSLNNIRKIKAKELISMDSNQTIIFNSDITLKITYQKEYESQEYLDALANSNVTQTQSLRVLHQRSLAQPEFQTSYLDVLKKEGIMIAPSGKVLDPKELIVSGYLAWERISDLVPLDYDPKKRISIKK